MKTTGLFKLMSVLLALIPTIVSAQLANDKCRFLGNIIAGSTPSNFTTYWNQITPENGGKWGTVEATRDAPNWTQLDNAYNTAQTNNFLFKQHTFVWGQQQPAWMSGATLTAAEKKEEVEEWIQTYCARYPDTDMIDVVNEPLHAVPDYYTALGGTGTTGWDWVIWSFEKARAYCPNSKLILNDYNIISNNGATTSYLTIINLLKDRNLIDGIGEQGHFLETTSLATMTGNLDRLADTGLPIYISEFDLNFADDNQQSARYQEVFPLLWAHPGVRGITLWGYIQNQIWRTDAYLIRTNGTKRPALTWLESSYMPTAPGGIFCFPVTGFEENKTGLELYPNPAIDGNFTLELGEGNFEVKVSDARGFQVKNIQVSGGQPVNVHLDVAPGIYLLQISGAGQFLYGKVVIR